MKRDDVKYLLGDGTMRLKPLPVYSDLVCEFLDELSVLLRHDRRVRQYPDVLTFAFWCRKANIQRLREQYAGGTYQMGRGIAFHIAPSNVPINFAYSLVFGMLAGNGNIVRVPQKDFPQIRLVCDGFHQLLQEEKYALLRQQTQVVEYGHEKEINDAYSAMCDVRVIWGGDRTIAEIRRSPIGSRCVDIAFADRYSFAVFDEMVFADASGAQLLQTAEKFYNDTYLMDQNACSSPHLVLWAHPQSEQTGRKRFWKALSQVAEKYELTEKKAVDKFTMLCEKILQFPESEQADRYGNALYVVTMRQMPEKLEDLRGIFGLFYEADLADLQELIPKLNPKMQTCIYAGVDPIVLADTLMRNHAQGVDRIVGVGQGLDIGVYWDGYDIIRSLSREICIS